MTHRLIPCRYVDISPGPGLHYIFALEKISGPELPLGHVGFSLVQRKWATLSINQEIDVRPYRFDASADIITLVSFETDFLQKKTTTQEPYDSDEMAKEFLMQFAGMPLTVGQTLVFQVMVWMWLPHKCMQYRKIDSIGLKLR